MFSFNTTSIIAYALILLTGGFIGYIQSSSLASLIAGSISSIILLFGVWSVKLNHAWGKLLSLTLIILLTLFFGFRFLKTGSWMPGGLMTIAGIITLLCQLGYSKADSQCNPH